MTASQSAKRIEAVQVLRALAAMLVVSTHAINVYDWRTDLPRPLLGTVGYFNAFGAIGVDIFFVISGFIMAHAMTSRTDLTAREFALQRFVRVAPPYWLASLVALPMTLLWVGELDPMRVGSAFALFPLGSSADYQVPLLGVGWSLSFELGFYLVVTMVVASLAKPGLRLLATLIAVITLALIGAACQPELAIVGVFLNAIWLEFAFGLLAYWVWSKVPAHPFVALLLLGAGLWSMGSDIVWGFGFSDNPPNLFAPHSIESPLGRNGLIRAIDWGLPSAQLVLGLLWFSQCKLGQWLTGTRFWLGAVALGDASYSLYLLHPFLFDSWWHFLPTNSINADLAIVVMSASSAALAMIAHRRIEKPLLAWARGLLARRARRSAKLLTV